MDLRHLRYFAAVADTCHFGQAAQQLHVAQPALSYAIRQLEAELDVTLFNRTTRQVSLTTAGEFLRGEAARILAGVDEAERGVRRIAAGRSGLLRLGLTGTAAFSHLPRIARMVKRELPGVALEIRADMLTPDQCDGLRAGALDLGVLRPPAVGEDIEMRTIDLETAGARGLRRPSAGRRARGVADRSAQRAVHLLRQPRLRGERRRAAQLPARRVRARAASTPHRGRPCCWHWSPPASGSRSCPSPYVPCRCDGVVFRDLADAGSIELALAWRRGVDNPLVTAAVDVLSSALSKETL